MIKLVNRYPVLILIILIALLLAWGCANNPPLETKTGYGTITATDLQILLAEDNPPLLLDVREPHEYTAGHIPGSVLIPMGEVLSRLSEIPRDQTVVVVCRSGNRSGQVAEKLAEQGYTNVLNLQGGVLDWPKPLQPGP